MDKKITKNCKYLSFISGVSVQVREVKNQKMYIFHNSNGYTLISCFGYGSAKNIAKAIKLGKMLYERKEINNAHT